MMGSLKAYAKIRHVKYTSLEVHVCGGIVFTRYILDFDKYSMENVKFRV